MYTPGTIKAIGLMSKGVSSSAAFREADNIDIQAAQTRTNFYNKQALEGGYNAAPLPSLSTQVATPSLPSMIQAGTYTRNTGDGGYLNAMMATPEAPQVIAPSELVGPPRPKKLKTFFDDKFMPTKAELAQQEAITPTDNTNYIDKKLYNGGWGLKSDVKPLDQAILNTVNNLDIPIPRPGAIDLSQLRSPEQKVQLDLENKERTKSLENMTKNFLTAQDLGSLQKSKKLLLQEVNNKLKRLDDDMVYFKGAAVRAQDRESSDQFQEYSSNAQPQIAELQKIKKGIEDTYLEKAHAFEAKKSTTNIKALRGQYKNDDEFLKSLDGYKNKAGGLGVVNSDISTLLKSVYKEEYLDKPLTEKDIEKGGPQALNEMALNRFLEGSALTNDEEKETRYNGVKGHLIESHAKMGGNIINELTNDIISTVKKQEALIKQSKDPNLTDEQAEELQNQFALLSKEVDFNKKLITKVAEIHDPKNYRSNGELKGFLTSYLDLEDKKQAKAEIQFGEPSWRKAGFSTWRTGQHLFSGVALIPGQMVETVGKVTGWDWLETKSRRFNNMVTIDELVNFERVNRKGQFQTTADYTFIDASGEKHYQPSTLFYQGAQMTPLVVATLAGGTGITALAGRGLNAGMTTLIGKGLMSATRARQFTQILGATNSYSKAFQAVTAASKNPLVNMLSQRVPGALAMGSIVYPQTYVTTYNDLYERGIENASAKAHAIAAISTSIEVITENAFPEMRYLDEFAEKGIFGKSWRGTLQQYRTLYGDVFKDAFSPKALDYLATRSLALASKGAAVGRLVASRGAEEGLEEVTAEILNVAADNLGLANLQAKPKEELTLEGIESAFAGAFVSFPFGVKNQIKQYKENRKYGEMYDIMLNAQYYKNKVQEAVKAGEMKQDKAAEVISKIQELESVEKEYGISKLRNARAAKVTQLVDLMEDPNIQFDYFKNVLKQKSIEEKLTGLEKNTYTPEQKEELLKQAEEANTKISGYKERSDFYSQMTDDDKKAVIDENVKKKLGLGRLSTSSNLESVEKEVDDFTALAIAEQRPQYFVDSMREYRDSLSTLVQERKQAEQNAIQAGTYNPIVDHIENSATTTNLESISTEEELVNALAQAYLAPDRGKDLIAFLNGYFDQQIEALDVEQERHIDAYLQTILGENYSTVAQTAEQGVDENSSYNREEAMKQLNEKQNAELTAIAKEYNDQVEDLVKRKTEVDGILKKAITKVIPRELLEIEDQEERDQKQTEWWQGIVNQSNDLGIALTDVIENADSFSQSVFYDSGSFLDFKDGNRKDIDKKVEERRQRREEAQSTKDGTEVRETITTEEIDSETGEKIEVTSPELLPSDVTPEFTEAVEMLESMPETEVVTTQNETEAELVTSEEYNQERAAIIGNLLEDVLASDSLEAAQAKMRVVMEAAGSTPQDIIKTLELIEAMANDKPLFEEDYTHMFEMLLIKANMDTSKLKFAPRVVESPVEVEEIDVVENIPVQLTDAKADIEKRRKEELDNARTDSRFETREEENAFQAETIERRLDRENKEKEISEAKSREEIADINKKYDKREALRTKKISSPFESEEGKAIVKAERDKINAKYDAELAALGQPRSAEGRQLNLLEDQPRLTPQEVAAREERERIQREEELQDAIADEQLYMEYQMEKEAFLSSVGDLPPIAQALDEMRVTRDSFVESADKANLQGREGKAIIFGYIGKKGEGFSLDRIAERATDLNGGREISTQDLVDFILQYPGGIGGVTSKSATSFYGSMNPDTNPRYSGIKDLIAKKKKEARAKKSKKAKTIIEAPVSPFDTDFNVGTTEVNHKSSGAETNPQPPKNEEQVSQVNNQTQLMETSPVFIPSSENHKDAKHAGVQEKITRTIDKEHRTTNTSIVDLFSVIEQVLGESTLQQMETIFNEVKSKPTPERLAQLKSEFMALFPEGFMKASALNYMFDSQMVGNVSRVDVNQQTQVNKNATQTEIFTLNKPKKNAKGEWQPKTIAQINLKDGRVIRDVEVLSKNDSILFLKKTPILDAEGNPMLDSKGNEMFDKQWFPFLDVKDPETVLTFPIIASEGIDFKDLNALTFTAVDTEGRVQKFDSEGNKTNNGNQALLVYLPTSKRDKGEATSQQKAMDGLRGKVKEGERVNKGVQLNGRPRVDKKEQKDGTITRSLVYEFFTDEMILVTESLSPVETKNSEKVNRVMVNADNQAKTIGALNKLVAKAKTIPDPDKVGYIIDGEKYERQSKFTERTLGKEKTESTDETEIGEVIESPEETKRKAEQKELMELGAAVGNLLDIIGRDVLAGHTLKSRKQYIAEAEGMGKLLRDGKGYKLELTQEQFDAVVKELEEFKKELNRKGYQLFTEGLVVYRKFSEAEKLATGYAGVAGAMDIVAVDADGGVHIIDFKNKKFRNEQHFKNGLYISTDKIPSNIKKWGSQQTTYAILSEDFDLPVASINIYAYASQYEVKDGVITINMLTQAANRVPVLPQNKSDISDAVIKLTYDNNVMSQLDLRTANPKASEPINISENQINEFKQTNKEFTDSEAKNALLILNSLGLTLGDTKNLDDRDQTPETKNPPPCK